MKKNRTPISSCCNQPECEMATFAPIRVSPVSLLPVLRIRGLIVLLTNGSTFFLLSIFRYNDISPLENHHCSIAFRLLEHPDCNIFRNMDKDLYK